MQDSTLELQRLPASEKELAQLHELISRDGYVNHELISREGYVNHSLINGTAFVSV